MATNEFVIEFLPDGRLKIQTSDFDAGTHVNADKLMDALLALGEIEEAEKVKKALHVHKAGQKHTHKA